MIEKLKVILSVDSITLIFALIAIIVSLLSLKENKKGAVLEHCLIIFGKVNEVYQQCCKLLEIKNGNDLSAVKNKIAYTILPFYSEQQKIALRIVKHMDEDSNYNANDELGNQYVNLYISSIDYNFLEKCEIFYSKDILKSVKKLYDWYDMFQLEFILLNQDEIFEKMNELKDIIQDFENKDTLKKIKKKIVIP